jgi:hypothetical protein
MSKHGGGGRYNLIYSSRGVNKNFLMKKEKNEKVKERKTIYTYTYIYTYIYIYMSMCKNKVNSPVL